MVCPKCGNEMYEGDYLDLRTYKTSQKVWFCKDGRKCGYEMVEKIKA